MIISVFSYYSHTGKTLYSLNLALSLQNETHKPVLILEIIPKEKMHSLAGKLEIPGQYKIIDLGEPLPEPLKITSDFIFRARFNIDLICLWYNPENESCIKNLREILNLVAIDYGYIILDFPSDMNQSVFEMMNQSDVIQILTSPDAVGLKRTRFLVERLKADFLFQEEKIKIIINEYKLSRLKHAEQKKILNQRIFATLPRIGLSSSERLALDEPAGEYAKAIKRIARAVKREAP